MRRGVLLWSIWLFIPSFLAADTVLLEDGNRIENVRVIRQAARINVVHRDGNVQSYLPGQVHSVERLPVSWEPTEAEEAERFEADLQRRAAAEARRARAAAERIAGQRRLRYITTAYLSGLFPGGAFWSQDRYGLALAYHLAGAALLTEYGDAYQDRRRSLRLYEEDRLIVVGTFVGTTVFSAPDRDLSLLVFLQRLRARRSDVISAGLRQERALSLYGVLLLAGSLHAFYFVTRDESGPGTDSGNAALEWSLDIAGKQDYRFRATWSF